MTFKQAWKQAEAHELKMRGAISAAHKGGKGRLAKHLTRQYLRAFDSRLVASYEAYRRMPRHSRPHIDELPSIATSLSAWGGTSEKVGVMLKPKAHDPNDFRIVMAFGIENRALQYLVRNCIAAQVNLHPAQFAVRLGRTKAVERVRDALIAGHTHVVQWDIKNCFNSFNGEKLNSFIPLPKEVIKRVITPKCFTLIDDSMYAFQPGELLDESFELFAEARQGIAQGSAISSLVAEVVLAPVVEHVSKLGIPIAYADNLLLMAQTSGEMVTMSKALCTILREHPAGPLWLNQPSASGPGEAFDFLGYKFAAQGAGWDIRPSERNLLRYEARFSTVLKRIGSKDLPHDVRESLIKSLRASVNAWGSAFSLWSGAKQHCKEHLELIKQAAP